MALVFDEPREGPAMHALIIGVEHATETPPFSAALAAAQISDWLLSADIGGAPLASVDLLASDWGVTRDAYFSPRDGRNYRLDPPDINIVRSAAEGWRQRLKSDVANIGFFYFVGPTVEFGPDIHLVMGHPGKGMDLPSNIVDFTNLWIGMGVSRRQLYFIDGCRSLRSTRKPPQYSTLLMGPALPETASGHRALYFGRTPPGPVKASPGQSTCLATALTEVFAGRRTSITTRELAGSLGERFSRVLARVGIADEGGLTTRIENQFELHFTSAAAKIPATGTKGPPPRKASPFAKRKGADEASLPPEPADAIAAEVDETEAEPEPKPAVEETADPGGPIAAEADEEAMAADLAARIARLSKRQRNYLLLVSTGATSMDIARNWKVSPSTVDRHIRSAMDILGIKDRRAAAHLVAESVAGRQLIAGADAFDPQTFRERETGGDAGTAERSPPEEEPADSQAEEPDDSRAEDESQPNTRFVTDDPEIERDELGRGALAIALGRRLHQIWCQSNGIAALSATEGAGEQRERSAFVLHIDAPWGGGKTSFANFLGRVLNPFPSGARAPAEFLRQRAGNSDRVGTIFIDNPAAEGKGEEPAADWPDDARRPWIVVPFNAWQAEHCAPPWWVFYQAIRKGCFDAVWAEGTAAAAPAQARPPLRPLIEERIWTWARLWRRELWWRLRNPKVIALFCTFALAAALTFVLWKMELIFRSKTGVAFDAGNAIGFVLAGLTGISGLWGLGALLTESVAPGTDDLAERRSLGSGDPFERFRRHFRKTMLAVRRPVMVIVDDLDRCRPDFVVDLVRGIQTLLTSPRVVFVILGDRDWIERAFEAHHEAMSKVNVGAEQSFGARFVEKAIQMSFVLPKMPKERQDAYVRGILLGPAAKAAALPAAAAEISQDLRTEYREVMAAAETVQARSTAENDLLVKWQAELQTAARRAAEEAARAAPADAPSPPRPAVALTAKDARAQVATLLDEERALFAAVDKRVEEALLHRLQPLAPFFPANPRQIKRIVNAITMYNAVASLQFGLKESDPRGFELAIWVIVMTEWPETWRALAGCPALADHLWESDPERAQAASPPAPAGDPAPPSAAMLREARRIRADTTLLALIVGEDGKRLRLRSSSVLTFMELTPLYSRKPPPAEEEEAPAGTAAARPAAEAGTIGER